MPAKRLSALLHRSKVPTAQSAPSAGGGGAVPGMGRVSQCTYAYAKGQSANRVKVSVMPATGQKDADTFVRAVLGRGSKTITGAGDSAGVKVGMGGYGMKLLAAARRIDQEIAGVTILMPEKIPANRYRAVVNEVFGHVA